MVIFTDKIIGAASGFGLCTTKQLISKGCYVLAVDINQEALDQHFGSQKDFVRTFTCKTRYLTHYLFLFLLLEPPFLPFHFVRALCSTGDISRTEDVEKLCREVQQLLRNERGGQALFGLVNNAGIVLPAMPILDTPEDKIRRVIEARNSSLYLIM